MIENMLQGDILEYFLDNIPAFVYVKDLDLSYTYINQALESFVQVKRSELANKKYTDSDFFTDKAEVERWMKAERKVIEGGKAVEAKHMIRKAILNVRDNNNDMASNKSGDDCKEESKCSMESEDEERWFLNIQFPLKNAEGKIVGLCGFCHDITQSCREESRTHEFALQKSENRFRSLFQHIENAFALHEIVSDDQGNPTDYVFVEVNDSFEKMTGLQANEILGKRATQVFPEEGIDKEKIGRYGKVAQNGAVERFEQYSEPMDKWYMGLAFRPQQNEFATLFIDITERIQIEEALRQSEERHRTLFEKMMQGVVYQNSSGGIISANPSAERILGLTIDQMMGRTSVDPRWKSVKEDGSDYPGDTHPAMVALQTGKPVINSIMGVFHPADNSQHWISIDAVPLFKPNESKPFQVYTTFTDITEQKKIEREILKAKEKAEEADKLKSAFLANMSHEIRTPLNGIMGHIDIALSNNLSSLCRDENIEGLEVAKESGYLLVSIINDILDLSKIEAGQMAIGMEPFSLPRLISQSIKIGNVLLKSRKKASIVLSHHIDESISKCIYGDNFRIQQVINNLVSNAVKFTENGSVKLSVELDGEMLRFCVQDTGRGISEDQLEVIFEAFRQVDFSDTRKFSGTGLGLTISRKLVDMMGGSLLVESVVDKGSTFRFTLPYKQAPDESILECDKVVEKMVHSDSVTGGRILIAEDDPVSRKVATKMVENAGYDVVLAENGRIAVSKFESDQKIDLILMDVNMETLGGLEATSMIRSIEAKYQYERRIPIIGLSAAAMSGDRERGAASGMTDYLTKPVNRKALIATLQHYLGRKAENGSSHSTNENPTKKRRT
ncbi:MAG: hypothetical protein SGILL_004352 [Bacillariaceae sp.]